jgi:hypothetical protein
MARRGEVRSVRCLPPEKDRKNGEFYLDGWLLLEKTHGWCGVIQMLDGRLWLSCDGSGFLGG